jgi:hypothetical protein
MTSMNERALRRAALLVMLAGALASLGLMFYLGRRQSSWILMVLFTGWVLGPYVGLLVADRASGRWSSIARVALYCVMLTSTIGSVAIFAFVTFGPPRPKPAFYFLVVPVATWLLAGIVIPMTVHCRGGDSSPTS